MVYSIPSPLKPPTNLEDIRKRVAKSRETASPPESLYKRYVITVARATNEATMVFEVHRRLLKEYGGKGYLRAFTQHSWASQGVGFNNDLYAPQPDFAEGPRMEEYRPFPVDEHVNGAVLY